MLFLTIPIYLSSLTFRLSFVSCHFPLPSCLPVRMGVKLLTAVYPTPSIPLHLSDPLLKLILPALLTSDGCSNFRINFHLTKLCPKMRSIKVFRRITWLVVFLQAGLTIPALCFYHHCLPPAPCWEFLWVLQSHSHHCRQGSEQFFPCC